MLTAVLHKNSELAPAPNLGKAELKSSGRVRRLLKEKAFQPHPHPPF